MKRGIVGTIAVVMALAALTVGGAVNAEGEVCPVSYSMEHGTCEGYNPDGPDTPPAKPTPPPPTHCTFQQRIGATTTTYTLPSDDPQCDVASRGALTGQVSGSFIWIRPPTPTPTPAPLTPLGAWCVDENGNEIAGHGHGDPSGSNNRGWDDPCTKDDDDDHRPPEYPERRTHEVTATPVPGTGPDRTHNGTSVLNEPDPPASEGAVCPVWYSMKHGTCEGAP